MTLPVSELRDLERSRPFHGGMTPEQFRENIKTVAIYVRDRHFRYDHYTTEVASIPGAAVITPATFVRPKLDEYGTIKARQKILPGMLVYVEKKQAAWGNINYEKKFIGKVLDVSPGEVTVEVLAGSSDQPELMFVNRYTRGVRCQGRRDTVTRRSCTLLDPYKLPALWYAAATFAALSNKATRLAEKQRLLRERRPVDKRANTMKKYHWGRTEFEYNLRNNRGLAKGVRQLIVLMRGRVDDELHRRSQARLYTSKQWVLAFAAVNRNREVADQLRMLECGHVGTNNEGLPVVTRFSSTAHHCQSCASNLRMAVGADGEMVRVKADVTLHNWSDGTVRLVPEPSIIGGYHSSKKYMQLLGKPGDQPYTAGELTIGIELEMETSELTQSEDRKSAMARAVKVRMDAAAKEVGLGQRYAFFERDGSVEYGFEMVTSYGAIEVHRAMIPRIFGWREGEDQPKSTPFAGMLRSHDANSSCGLHVHLSKPKSLMHAVKLQAFFNDPDNKRLIRSVARRYQVNYARVDPSRNKENVNHNVKSVFRTYKAYGRDPEYAMNRAITSLTTDRYQQVNFSNDKTVEIRVFKGSMLPTTIMACIEFAAAIWHYSKDAKACDLTAERFLAWVCQPRNRKETGYLRAYLATRGWAVYVPRPYKQDVAVNEMTAEDA